MKKRNIFKIIILLCVLFTPVMAQNGEKQIKSLFVYNFTRYIQWPQADGRIVIGVLGHDPDILAAFKDMADRKSTAAVKIVVEQFSDARLASSYNLVYVPENNSKVIASIPALDRTLLVSEKPGMTKEGSFINFINHEGKIRFELNKKALEATQLKVSGQLMSLAIVV